jgi:DNA-binding NarL/FixJ family response regulator
MTSENPNPSPIRVAIVEDSAGVRRSLELLLNESPGFTCVCACASAEEALRQLPVHTPDVVLMDIHLPGLSGIECTARLKQLLPKTQVVMITVYTNTENVFKALRAGASGYLLKRSPPELILQAIVEVRQGGAPMTREIARMVVEAFKQPVATPQPEAELTPREREVLEQLAHGSANKEIAAVLQVSPETVRYHLKQIYEKLHVRSRTEALIKFMTDKAPPGPSDRPAAS